MPNTEVNQEVQIEAPNADAKEFGEGTQSEEEASKCKGCGGNCGGGGNCHGSCAGCKK